LPIYQDTLQHFSLSLKHPRESKKKKKTIFVLPTQKNSKIINFWLQKARSIFQRPAEQKEKKTELQRQSKKNELIKYLLLDTERVDIAVRDFPREEPIWVFTINAMNNRKNQNNEKTENPAFSHCSCSVSNLSV